MKPRVFISHSTKEEFSEQVLKAIKTVLEPDFHLLLDRDVLPPGEEWRHELHTWLGWCHAAVILFSPEALVSSWVLKEATILTWRRDLDKD